VGVENFEGVCAGRRGCAGSGAVDRAPIADRERLARKPITEFQAPAEPGFRRGLRESGGMDDVRLRHGSVLFEQRLHFLISVRRSAECGWHNSCPRDAHGRCERYDPCYCHRQRKPIEGRHGDVFLRGRFFGSRSLPRASRELVDACSHRCAGTDYAVDAGCVGRRKEYRLQERQEENTNSKKKKKGVPIPRKKAGPRFRISSRRNGSGGCIHAG